MLKKIIYTYVNLLKDKNTIGETNSRYRSLFLKLNFYINPLKIRCMVSNE